MDERIRLWLRGWSYQISRTWWGCTKGWHKAPSFRLAWLTAACGRWIIYGQRYGKRNPLQRREVP